METRSTNVKKSKKYIPLKSDSDHEMEESTTTQEPEDHFHMDSPVYAPFSQQIEDARKQLIYEAICNQQHCVEKYQDGVRLIFTEQTLARIFDSLKWSTSSFDRPFNQLYSEDFKSIRAACKKNNGVPIRGFRFNHVLGHIQLANNGLSRAGTLKKLQSLLKEYGPFLMSLDLSENQLTDAEGTEVMNVLSSVQSPLLHEINLSGNSVGRDNILESLQSYLKKASFLRTLELARCELNDEQFKKLLSALPQVQNVNACFNPLGHQTELFLRKHLQMAYSPALQPDDWKNPCQELLNIALEGSLVSHAFMQQEIPLLLKVRETQAKEWREKHLLSVAGRKEMIFTAVKKGEVSLLEALVFARGYQVNVDQPDRFFFKNYDQEIKILEEKQVALKTRYLEAAENYELLKDQEVLLVRYLKGEPHVQGEDALRITNVVDLQNALEHRLIVYREMKLNSQDKIDENNAHVRKELIQVQNVMQQEIQGDLLQHYQFPPLASREEVNRLYHTQHAKMESFEAKMVEHKMREARYYQRYNDLVRQKEERVQSWQISCMQGKLPLVWIRQLTNEQELRERLLNHPFDPNAIEEESGESLLHRAIWHDQLEVVELLLKAGANIAMCDRKDKTVIEVAIELKQKERRVLHLNAIINHMGQMKVDHNSLEFLLAYGKAAEDALRKMMDVCKRYGQSMVKCQELSGLKRFFDEIMNSASVRSARGHELSQYWESLWKHGSKGEVRHLINTWEMIGKNAKVGFFGLPNGALHNKAQAAVRNLDRLYVHSPKIENDIKKAIKEQVTEENLQHQISMRCQTIAQQSKKTEEERAIQEKKDADKLESERKLQLATIEIETLKADKLADKLESDKKFQESDKKFQESDKKIKESDIEIKTLKADKLADKLKTDIEIKTLKAGKLESDKKIKESDIEIKTLKADKLKTDREFKAFRLEMDRRLKEVMEAQQKKKKVKTQLPPVEEGFATSQTIEQENLLVEKEQEQEKQKAPGGLNQLFLFGKSTIHKLKNDPATIRLKSSIPQ